MQGIGRCLPSSRSWGPDPDKPLKHVGHTGSLLNNSSVFHPKVGKEKGSGPELLVSFKLMQEEGNSKTGEKVCLGL